MLKPNRPPTETNLVRAWISSAVALVATLLFAPAALADTSASANWAGYAVHRAGISFRSVSAAWTQPNAACSPGRPTYSAYWVGLGGYSATSAALEQIGTETDCDLAGRSVLSAWYELVPSPSTPIRLTVRAGDAISASVTVVGHQVTVRLNDLTRRRGFSKTLHASSIDVTAAEWIVEAPSDCVNISLCETLPLADFGTASFTQAKAVGSRGHVAPIAPAPWRATRIVLSPRSRRFVSYARSGAPGGSASPSSLQANGSAFTVSYSAPANQFLTVRAESPRPAGRLFH